MLGIIVRADDSGLGYQTWALARMLNPDKVLIIDGTPFNGFRQHFERYNAFKDVTIVKGIPTIKDIRPFLSGLTVVLTAETFYNPLIILEAKKMGVKTVNQINYEFFDPLQNPTYPKCDVYLAPSFWHLPYLARHHKAKYLPPPTFQEDFILATLINGKRTAKDKARFVHVAGKKAVHDRNGTQTLLDCLQFTKADFELVIYSQVGDFETADPRVTIITGGVENRQDLYSNFDAMILPRKYGGLCLPMNEALASGLPVIMTDVSPNNEVLPKEWLVMATCTNKFKARTDIDICPAHLIPLARKLTEITDKRPNKPMASKLGYLYSPERLWPAYDNLLKELDAR